MEQPKVSGRVKNKKRLIIIVVIVVVLVTSAVLLWLIFAKKGTTVSEACPSGALKEAGSNLVDPIDVDKLQKDATEIEKSSGYAKSSDCTFVTTFYELNYGSLDNAKSELAKLKAVFDPSKGYGPLVADHALSPDELQSQINDAQASVDASVNDPQGSAFTPGPKGN